MRINHNIAALNTHRQLNSASTAQGKSMEKLSSGLRINRAGDDAAGLAISEKMRGQIRGLDMASKNSQDAISLIQTAEGALNETHDILQRMRELAVQSANDTNTGGDRTKLQDELNQLTTEIDRISTTTEFNTQKLLDGSFKGTFQIGANESQSLNLSVNKMGAQALGLTSSATVENTAVLAANTLKDGIYTVDANGTDVKDADGNIVGQVNGADIEDAAGTAVITFTNDPAAGATFTIANGKAELKQALGAPAKELSAGNYEIKGTDLLKDGQIVGALTGASITSLNGKTLAAPIVMTDVGQTAAFADGDKFTINGADISSREKASGSITSINNAIENVSTERSKLGAVQNRLEHTINNLNTSSENLTAAESRVRDVDMAKEMMTQTKNSILAQAAQAMLAQANQQPQGVLQLLR
ncbi:flagellin [Paenibacillus sp. V4I7]|uniref:flagellin N-terminal helical domain-containing protein n=1 Tax=Paenibacillus sp. V4I7 TaxID=3042307 RepID=UPI00278A04DC|nr:flagellin [Paenibacillus sp. V4I7]MDQ0902942.1 flagellin [Paenibacillus sp. V4I7]